ncbi:MAG: hypothetical protein QOH96_1399 [Blastocatellia bacterium]|jgi:hypothetical protein|nr:hypothetical protein [Blastocatellia bacterium]
MSSLLSTISGYFTKSILLGTFLPVSVFVIAFLVLVLPLLPTDLQVLAPLAALDAQWQVLTITFCTVLLSGLLYSLNIPVIQLFEGYPWKDTWLGKLRTCHYQVLFRRRYAKVKGMRTLLRAMFHNSSDVREIVSMQKPLKAVAVDQSILDPCDRHSATGRNKVESKPIQSWNSVFSQIKTRWDDEQQALFSEFPTLDSLILPTKLGNVIRSFEYYPDREYGMDAVSTWSRLVAKIDPAYAASIDDAKTSFDFMINISFLSGILFFIQVVAGILYKKPFTSQDVLLGWSLHLLICIFLMAGFYQLSISRAGAWGEMVKGAFDLYRKDLLSQLGYEQKLTTKEEERDLWGKISVQMLYGDKPDGPQAPSYVTEPSTPSLKTFTSTEPNDVNLKILRGIEDRLRDGTSTVVLCIKNVDEKRRRANGVIITDVIVSGREYQFGSACVEGRDVFVEGTNPYRFSVGTLSPNDELVLKYKTVRKY